MLWFTSFVQTGMVLFNVILLSISYFCFKMPVMNTILHKPKTSTTQSDTLMPVRWRAAISTIMLTKGNRRANTLSRLVLLTGVERVLEYFTRKYSNCK